MKITISILSLASLLSLSSCADWPISFGHTSSVPATPPAITTTGEDLRTAAAEATQAYIDIKHGDADFAWSVKKGLEAYKLYVKTKADVEALVQQWSDGKAAGKTFAQRLANLFASSTGTPQQKADVIAGAVGVVAASNISP
jgi:hypothetical protein